MFKYISEILSHFSQTQRVMALLMLLTTITIITIGPNLINSITTDRTELELKISKQTERINSLENHIDTLDLQIRESKKSCTREIYARENEFIKMLDEIKAETFKYSKIENRPVMMNSNGNDGNVMMEIPKQYKNEVKVDILPIISKIDKIKYKIKH